MAIGKLFTFPVRVVVVVFGCLGGYYFIKDVPEDSEGTFHGSFAVDLGLKMVLGN